MADAPQMDPIDVLRKMREMENKMSKSKKRKKPLPGAGDQELYPTDRGAVEFRLARRGRKRGGPTLA